MSASGEVEAAGDASINWFKELSARERQTFWASFGGFGLDAMDLLLYSYVVPTLIVLWAMTQAQAGVIATTALLVSALGGWIGGLLSDRWGRSVTLQATVLWFSAFTALSGLTNGFGQLLVVRGLQGLGFGAEWAVGAALLGEVVHPRNRGKALGFVQSAYAFGWGGASLVYAATFALLPETIAWRTLFFVGLLPALFVVYLRRNVGESEAFKERKAKAIPSSAAEIFSAGMIWTTVFAALLAMGVQGGYYAFLIWLPTFMRTVRHLTVLGSSSYVAVVICGAIAGYWTGAYLTDAIGRKRTFAIFSICSIAIILIYTMIPVSDAAMLLLGAPLGYFPSGVYSGLGAYLTELFPTRMRGSGMGFTYNVGRAVGAMFPTLVGLLSAHIGLGPAIGIFTASAYALVLLSILALPETRGRTLTP